MKEHVTIMGNIQIFNHPKFGDVRTAIAENGSILFCLSDVARSLGYARPADAVSSHCKKGVCILPTPTQNQYGAIVMQDMKYGPEGCIYRLTLKSQLPDAEEFQDWVCDDVLPSIRKNGGYIINQQQMTPEQIVANALIVAQNIINTQQKELAVMKPKADFFDAVADSKDAISIGSLAKVLGIKGMGRNNLFEFLRQNKVLMNDNTPYQRYVDSGMFRVVEQKYMRDGEPCINIKTLVYQKGVNYVRSLIMNKHAI